MTDIQEAGLRRLLKLAMAGAVLATILAFYLNWYGSPSLLRGLGEVLAPVLSAGAIWYALESLWEGWYVKTTILAFLGTLCALGSTVMIFWRAEQLNTVLLLATALQADVSYWHSLTWQAWAVDIFNLVASVVSLAVSIRVLTVVRQAAYNRETWRRLNSASTVQL